MVRLRLLHLLHPELSVRQLREAGLLRSSGATWPPPEARWKAPPGVLQQASAPTLTVRPSFARGLLELEGLAPGLTVLIEPLPFHKSPGRWHFRCPACGQRRGVLARVGEPGTPAARALGWACRTCAGLPHSRSWPLNPHQRLDNALEKAADEGRHHGEKARDWRRRRQRAAQAITKAEALDGLDFNRLSERLT